MTRKPIKCPACGTSVHTSDEELIENGYRTQCDNCGAQLQIIGDFAYIPADEAQAQDLQSRATTPPPFTAGNTGEPTMPGDLAPDGRDPLLNDVINFLKLCNAITPMMLVARFGIDPERALHILDTLEQDGIVGPEVNGAPRKILIPHNTNLPGPFIPIEDNSGEHNGPRVININCATGCLPVLLVTMLIALAMRACM